MAELIDKKQKLSLEIIRFVIVGILSTIIDFAISSLTAWICQKSGMDGKSVWVTVISTAVGFLISVIFNYIMSLIWVFQNVDKDKKMNKYLHIFLFILLSAIGLGIGIGIMAIFKYSFLSGLNINIDEWMNPVVPENSNWFIAILSSAAFWLYVVAFVVKTLIVLFYNYVSRKKILFKPKESESK